MGDICHSKLWNAKEKVSLGIVLCGDPQTLVAIIFV